MTHSSLSVIVITSDKFRSVSQKINMLVLLLTGPRTETTFHVNKTVGL